MFSFSGYGPEGSPVGPGTLHVYPLSSASGCSPGKVWSSSPCQNYSSSPLCWGHPPNPAGHLSAFWCTGTPRRGSGLSFMSAQGRAKCGSVSKWEIKERPLPSPAEPFQRTEATLRTSLPLGGFYWASPHGHPSTVASQNVRDTLTISRVSISKCVFKHWSIFEMFTFHIRTVLTLEGTVQYKGVIHKRFRIYKSTNS